jgi:hypothetical protein
MQLGSLASLGKREDSYFAYCPQLSRASAVTRNRENTFQIPPDEREPESH